MKNLSNKAKLSIYNKCPIYAYAKIILADRTELTLTSQEDFFISGNSYSQSGGDGFPLGVAVCKTINVCIDNHSGKYNEYDFYKATISLFTEIDINDNGITTVERIPEGIFTVIDAVTPCDVIEFTAYDYMYRANRDYVSNLTYPATLTQILVDVCRLCDIPYIPKTFNNSEFKVFKKPNVTNARTIIGAISQIAGGNAVISSAGNLQIINYNFDTTINDTIISGSSVDVTLKNQLSGNLIYDNLDDYTSGYEITDKANYHILEDFNENPTIGTDYIKVTGIMTKKGDNTLVEGTTDYALMIDNPLIIDNETEAISLIADILLGNDRLHSPIFKPFSGSFSPNPAMEFMDNVIIVDRNYNIHKSFITGITFTYMDKTDVENTSESPDKHMETYSNAITSVYQKVSEMVEKTKTPYEQAITYLTDTVSAGGGLFSTTIKEEDNSVINYFHNKADLYESDIVIKITANGMGIYNGDGIPYDTSKPFITGITTNGMAVLSLLTTIGINADYINTNTIVADKIQGGTLTLGRENNIDGSIEVKDVDNNVIGEWDELGLHTNAVKLKTGEDFATIGLMGSQVGTGNGIAVIEGNNKWFGLFKASQADTATDPIITHGVSDNIKFYTPINLQSNPINNVGTLYTNAISSINSDTTLNITNDTTIRLNNTSKLIIGGDGENVYPDVEFYRNLNMHNYQVQNPQFKFDNGDIGITTDINILTGINIEVVNIERDGDAITDFTIQWQPTTQTIKVKNGLIVGVN